MPYITVPDARKTIEVYKGLFGATLVDHMPFTKEVGQSFGFPDDDGEEHLFPLPPGDHHVLERPEIIAAVPINLGLERSLVSFQAIL
ncbi:hypothetical protein KAI10_01945 [Candidatus Bathyarchaeota archaeon]|nr:hypothetical protein [Candidatus Bathyarchaeota archaeon]